MPCSESYPELCNVGHLEVIGVLLLNSAAAYISREWLQLQSPVRAVCAVHSMQTLPNYFGLLFIALHIVELLINLGDSFDRTDGSL